MPILQYQLPKLSKKQLDVLVGNLNVEYLKLIEQVKLGKINNAAERLNTLAKTIEDFVFDFDARVQKLSVTELLKKYPDREREINELDIHKTHEVLSDGPKRRLELTTASFQKGALSRLKAPF